MIVISLQDLVDDFEGVCRLARKSDEGEIVMYLSENLDTPDESDNSGHFVEESVNSLTASLNEKDEKILAASSSRQRGFSMIELLIAVTIISITLLAVGALTSVSVNGIGLVLRKRAAENYAVALTSK